MQAIQSFSSLMIQTSLQQLELEGIRKLSFTGLLFLSLAVPMAGSLENLDSHAMEDSHQDLGLEAVVDRFQQRLPARHKKDALKLGRALMRLSEKHRLSPGLLLSVIDTESSFRYEVESKAGAIGLMQLLPATAAEVARRYKIRGYHSKADLRNPLMNMELGAAYLAYLRTRFGNSLHYLAAYNMGPSALKVRMNRGNYDLGSIQNYVDKIQGRTLALRERARSQAEITSLMAVAQ